MRVSKSNIDPTHIATLVAFLALLAIGAVGATSFWVVSGAVVSLGLAVMAAIHHAGVIAKRIGPALGALLLAIAVTVIEVGLILSMMSNGGENAAVVARDTVYSAIIIVTNGIAGSCFLLGGIRFRELEFRVEGTTSLLAVLGTLVAVTLILPNFTTTTPGPTYSTAQLVFVAAASILLYVALIVSQTVTHKDYFAANTLANENGDRPSKAMSWISFAALLLSLVAVIGLAKLLSPSIEAGVIAIGAPRTVVGIVIALLVLLPETGAAVAAARSNDLQTSLNLALGSGAASVALTIPVISLYSIASGTQVSLGLDPKEIAFTLLTFIISGLTMATGRMTALKGFVHLVILFSYLALSFVP